MNTSQCMYDLGVCLSEEIDEESMLCTKSLHNDTICDFQNFLPECNFDGGDCQFEKGTFSIQGVTKRMDPLKSNCKNN